MSPVRCRLVPMLLLTVAAVPGSLLAQRDGGVRPMPRGEMAALFDPVVLNGPPPPEEMVDIVGTDVAQYERYAERYRTFMAATQPARDSLIELREMLRDQLAGGSPRESRGRVRPSRGAFDDTGLADLAKRLNKEQKAFDDALKDLLTDDQMKKYDAWRERARRRVMEDMGIPMRDGRPPA